MLSLMPPLIQVLIIIRLVQVVYRPLQHIFHLDSAVIAELYEITYSAGGYELIEDVSELDTVRNICEGSNAAYSAVLPGDAIDSVKI